jgi:hypothetical protein
VPLSRANHLSHILLYVKKISPYITLCQEDWSVCVILCAIDRFCLCPINPKKNLLRQMISCFLMGKQESGSSRKTEADRVVRDWPQKLNSIIDNHRDPIEIKDTSRDLHSFALSLWISLVTLIAV